MSVSRTATNAQSLAIEEITKGVELNTKRPGETMANQIPCTILNPTNERSQRNVESDNWFTEANRHVTSQIHGLGDDTPFFLEDSGALSSAGHRSSSPNLNDPILSYMRTNDTEKENEELRDIIDDLTLDIKRLRRKIRRYKEKDPPHLRKNKLFDIRTFGLSSRRKRHLEKILQRFAADISASPRFTNKRQKPSNAKHATTTATFTSEDAQMALVAMLFEQLLCSSCVEIDKRHVLSKEPLFSGSHGPWYDMNDMLSSIKDRIAHIDINLSRNALKRYSANLEVSADGEYVRWQLDGKPNGLALPTTVSESRHQHMPNYSKKTSASSESLLGQQNSPLCHETINNRSTNRHKKKYTPYTFANRDSEADEDVVSVMSSDSELNVPACGSDVGSRTSTHVEGQVQPSYASQGRATYYKNTAFYIDYSGDSVGVMEHDQHGERTSRRSGMGRKRKRQGSIASPQQYQRGLSNGGLDQFASTPNEKDEPPNTNPYQCSSPVLSLAEMPLTSVSERPRDLPKKLEASGVGGVIPDDNFAIYVMMEHAPVNPLNDANEHSSKNIQGYNQENPIKSQALDHSLRDKIVRNSCSHRKLDDQRKNAFKSCIVSSTHEKLRPSSLPPATCGFFSSIGSDDDGGDGDDENEDFELGGCRSHCAFATRLRDFVLDNGEPSTPRNSIQKWSAQVVASMGDTEAHASLSESPSISTD